MKSENHEGNFRKALTLTVDVDSGNDMAKVRTIGAAVMINANNGDDTINLVSIAPRCG